MPDDARHDPEYSWPAGDVGATHNDLAAAVEHMKAWFKREFSPAPPNVQDAGKDVGKAAVKTLDDTT